MMCWEVVTCQCLYSQPVSPNELTKGILLVHGVARSEFSQGIVSIGFDLHDCCDIERPVRTRTMLKSGLEALRDPW